ncbi:MAG: class I SAM-dependent rRNA methyltransferase [Desulfurococcales archaeon]|nr:class I SAM-dependent rRNA methyltransferase [Desulfurococcales archaeon]
MPVKLDVHGEAVLKLRRGTAIVYRKWISGGDGLSAASLVELYAKGEPVGCGLWESRGPVAVRVLEHGRCSHRDPVDMVHYRLESSLRARERMNITYMGSYRLVNSDGDLLSGLIVDVYNDVAVIQSSSTAMDALMDEIARILIKLAGVSHVYEKSLQRSRREIGLEPRARWLAGRREEVIIEEGGARFIVDVVRGQKTGFFLDQRPNRLELARITGEGDRVLDVFSYTGGFGIHAAISGAREVTFIEEDPVAVSILKRNLELNGVRRYNIIHDSVWRVRNSIPEGRFDIVIVDPPAFIQEGSKSSIMKGVKAYRKIYLWATGKASKSSTIYLSSCSYFLKRDMYIKIISEVMSLKVGEYKIMGSIRGSGPDHVFRGEEYLDYLKGAFIYIG